MINRIKILLAIVFFISACSEQFQSDQTLGNSLNQNSEKLRLEEKTSLYEMVQIDETDGDISAPQSYSQKILEYPQLKYGATQKLVSEINKKIVALVKSFACENTGDQHFSSTVTYMSDKLFSFKYDAAWSCSGMPHMDSTSGGYTINLSEAEEVTIDSEYRSDSEKKAFSKLIENSISDSLEVIAKENDIECPDSDFLLYFYVAKDDVVFGKKPLQHYYASCASEVSFPKSEIKKYLVKNSILLM